MSVVPRIVEAAKFQSDRYEDQRLLDGARELSRAFRSINVLFFQ